jgi:hypothetical protein
MSDKPLTMHPFESAIVRTLEADNARLAAEVERLKRQVAEWVDAGGEAHSVIERQMEDRAKLRSALLVARKYVLVQSCELSLQPDDAARDLDVIDEALEEDDD